MRWFATGQKLGLHAALVGVTLGLCGWQWNEHRRFRETAAQSLINRGRDITSTLGIVIGSQRRFGLLVSKERIEASLQALIQPGSLESIIVLGATGETIASAGRPVEITPAMLRERGVFWREQELVLMNLADFGSPGPGPEDKPLPSAVVVSNPRFSKALRAPQRPSANPGAENAAPRAPFGRPTWMSQEEYEGLIRTQGVHSLVISLSTVETDRAVRADLWLRLLVAAMGSGAALVSSLAWRNFNRNSELRIRLLKAGEMNSHLARLNLVAAGLAHETRNPLNLIRGHAQLVSTDTSAAPDLREHAGAILEEADRVTVQLNQFIDYAKPRQPQLAPVELARLAADVARTLLPDIEDKGVKLTTSPEALVVEADPQLFRQALFNLILNAIQAVGTGGRVDVDWRVTPDSGVVIEVRDDGPGVPEELRGEIFKPYVTKRPGGAGLGLAIVWQIVATHGWEIVCLGNAPRGAIFRISHARADAVRHEA
ncbi:MAG: sensor histidine kinase [Opitutaceae bacterium]